MKTDCIFFGNYWRNVICLVLFFLLTSLNLVSQTYVEIQISETADTSVINLGSFGRTIDIEGNQVLIGSFLDSKNEEGEDSLQAAGAVYVLEQGPARSWSKTQILTPENRQASSLFGYALSVDRNYAAITFRGEVLSINQKELAVIFKKETTGEWKEKTKLVGTNIHQAIDVLPVVDIYDSLVILGYPKFDFEFENQLVQNNGKAFVFQRNEVNEEWTEVAQLQVGDSISGNNAGWSVKIWEEFAFLGAPYEDEDEENQNTKSEAGAVQIFKRDTIGNWNFHQKLVANDRQINDRFGFSLEIHDSTLIVGAWGKNGYRGKIYTFQLNSLERWELDQQILAQDNNPGDGFGYFLSTGVNNRMIVGAPFDDHAMGPDQGSVYIFERQTDGQWIQLQKIFESQGGVDRKFGQLGLAINDNSAIAAKIGGGTYHFEVCAANHELIKVQACEPMDYYGHWLDSTGLYENLALEVDWNCDSLSADVQFDLIEVDTAVVRQGDSLVAMAVGAEFQWIRCGQGWPELPGIVPPDFRTSS